MDTLELKHGLHWKKNAIMNKVLKTDDKLKRDLLMMKVRQINELEEKLDEVVKSSQEILRLKV